MQTNNIFSLWQYTNVRYLIGIIFKFTFLYWNIDFDTPPGAQCFNLAIKLAFKYNLNIVLTECNEF